MSSTQPPEDLVELLELVEDHTGLPVASSAELLELIEQRSGGLPLSDTAARLGPFIRWLLDDVAIGTHAYDYARELLFLNADLLRARAESTSTLNVVESVLAATVFAHVRARALALPLDMGGVLLNAADVLVVEQAIPIVRARLTPLEAAAFDQILPFALLPLEKTFDQLQALLNDESLVERVNTILSSLEEVAVPR